MKSSTSIPSVPVNRLLDPTRYGEPSRAAQRQRWAEGQFLGKGAMRILLSASISVMLVACASTSGVMEAEDGTFLISATAAPARGGTAGANAVAYEEAQKFCAAKSRRAVVVTAAERDVQQSAASGTFTSQGGSFGGGSFAAGRANLRFRCVA